MSEAVPALDPVLSRNNVQVFGAGPRTIVFSHGFGADQRIWRELAPSFATEARVVLLDHVGCGRSDLTAFDAERYGDLEAFADDLIEICRALDLRDAVLVGHSVGSVIGVLAAIKQPELFPRLVMIAASASYLNEGTYKGGYSRAELDDLIAALELDQEAWSQKIVTVAANDPSALGQFADIKTTLASMPLHILRAFARTTLLVDVRAKMAQCQSPVLLIQCRDDLFVPPTATAYLLRQLRYAELTVVQGRGHFPLITHPQEVRRAIRAFLDAPHRPG